MNVGFLAAVDLPVEMPEGLRSQVDGFYADFNTKLARQLGDDRFLWRR
jgi:hypothetical protein